MSTIMKNKYDQYKSTQLLINAAGAGGLLGCEINDVGSNPTRGTVGYTSAFPQCPMTG